MFLFHWFQLCFQSGQGCWFNPASPPYSSHCIVTTAHLWVFSRQSLHWYLLTFITFVSLLTFLSVFLVFLSINLVMFYFLNAALISYIYISFVLFPKSLIQCCWFYLFLTLHLCFQNFRTFLNRSPAHSLLLFSLLFFSFCHGKYFIQTLFLVLYLIGFFFFQCIAVLTSITLSVSYAEQSQNEVSPKTLFL